MQHRKNERSFLRLQLTTAVGIGTVLLAVSSVPLCFAQKSTQETFPSAAEASHALFLAVQSDNEQAVMQILGGGKELASSADEVEDKLDREQFTQKYQEMHRLVREPDGATVLYIGAENWPFPIPLMSKTGAWYFDSEAGRQEIVFRRIGENEATAIETCHALVLASRRHESTTTGNDPVTQYAQTLVGDHATNARNDAPANKEEASGPFHGYYFRMLTGQHKRGVGGEDNVSDARPTGGYAFIAYPAEYRFSGVMTFVVTQNNVVYEKDLGPNTAKLAKEMTAGASSLTWHVAESQ